MFTVVVHISARPGGCICVYSQQVIHSYSRDSVVRAICSVVLSECIIVILWACGFRFVLFVFVTL